MLTSWHYKLTQPIGQHLFSRESFNFTKRMFLLPPAVCCSCAELFSCEEAVLKVQMLVCLCICVSVCQHILCIVFTAFALVMFHPCPFLNNVLSMYRVSQKKRLFVFGGKNISCLKAPIG